MSQMSPLMLEIRAEYNTKASGYKVDSNNNCTFLRRLGYSAVETSLEK